MVAAISAPSQGAERTAHSAAVHGPNGRRAANPAASLPAAAFSQPSPGSSLGGCEPPPGLFMAAMSPQQETTLGGPQPGRSITLAGGASRTAAGFISAQVRMRRGGSCLHQPRRGSKSRGSAAPSSPPERSRLCSPRAPKRCHRRVLLPSAALEVLPAISSPFSEPHRFLRGPNPGSPEGVPGVQHPLVQGIPPQAGPGHR